MAADSSTSAQRRRATKPLIEKRRRARINSSLAQLKEIVAKPSNKAQETRSNRLEKADILEMTVDYVKRLHERNTITDVPQKDVTATTDFEQSFKDGYKLCMSEVQNFFFKNYQEQASKEFLSRSLQNYLLQIYRKNLIREKMKLENQRHESETSDTTSSLAYEPTKMNNEFRNYRNNTNGNHELRSENSDLRMNNSCVLTDDEMTENYCIADTKDNSKAIHSHLLTNGVLPVRDMSFNSNHSMNVGDHVWRPW